MSESTPARILAHEVRDALALLSNDDQILIESIAMTLRNMLSGEQGHAALVALTLVWAEVAAAMAPLRNSAP